MNNINKKYIILFLGVIILFIIFAAVVFFQQSPTPQQQQSSSQIQQKVVSLHAPGQNVNNTPSVTLVPPSSSAKETTQLFYTYYFSSSTNPLANGAYKTNPYLSDSFKQVITGLYNNGNAPVFCPENKTENVIIDKEQMIYYNNSYMTQETISQAPPGTKDLYRVNLQNVNGKWLIFDVNCIE